MANAVREAFAAMDGLRGVQMFDDHLLVMPDRVEEKTEAGVHRTDAGTLLRTGTVMLKGPGKPDDPQSLEGIFIGQRVMWAFAPQCTVPLGGLDYHVMTKSDLALWFKEEPDATNRR